MKKSGKWCKYICPCLWSTVDLEQISGAEEESGATLVSNVTADGNECFPEKRQRSKNETGKGQPTALQSDAVSLGGDILIATETGYKKTGACLPAAQVILEKKGEAMDMDPERGRLTEKHEWRLNVLDRDNSLAIRGAFCESKVARKWVGSRCGGGVHSKGKYYYETRIVSDGHCRVGWSTLSATLNLGMDKQSFGFGVTGKKSHGGQFDDYGESFSTNDVLGCHLDLDNLCVWWSKNGKQFPIAYKLSECHRDPSASLHPAVLVQCSSLELNFGQEPFKYPPGGDFVAISDSPSAYQSWFLMEKTMSAVDPKNSPLFIVRDPLPENTKPCSSSDVDVATISSSCTVTDEKDSDNMLYNLFGIPISIPEPEKNDSCVSSSSTSNVLKSHVTSPSTMTSPPTTKVTVEYDFVGETIRLNRHEFEVAELAGEDESK